MRKVIFGFGLVFSLAAVSAATAWLRCSHAAIVPAAAADEPLAAQKNLQADGRVVTLPGKQVKLSAELSARVMEVRVVEGQAVKKGDLLAQLDDREIRGALREAAGTSAEAYARLRGRRSDLKRTKTLVASGALAPAENDHVREERSAAEGRLVASSGASLRARALLDKTRIVAPIDGVVVSRSIDPAETVAPGAPMFVIADLSARRVEAELDEYDVGRVALGIATEVSADAFPGQRWAGNVEEIADALGPRRLRPQDPSRPTDSAVLPVRVSLPPDTPLKLGQRVTVVFTPKN
jgi:RND family efflux transporter MFP subunit